MVLELCTSLHSLSVAGVTALTHNVIRLFIAQIKRNSHQNRTTTISFPPKQNYHHIFLAKTELPPYLSRQNRTTAISFSPKQNYRHIFLAKTELPPYLSRQNRTSAISFLPKKNYRYFIPVKMKSCTLKQNRHVILVFWVYCGCFSCSQIGGKIMHVCTNVDHNHCFQIMLKGYPSPLLWDRRSVVRSLLSPLGPLLPRCLCWPHAIPFTISQAHAEKGLGPRSKLSQLHNPSTGSIVRKFDNKHQISTNSRYQISAKYHLIINKYQPRMTKYQKVSNKLSISKYQQKSTKYQQKAANINQVSEKKQISNIDKALNIN